MGTSRGAPPEERVTRLERRNAELEVLYQTVRDLTSTLSVHQVLTRLLERTLQHLDAEIGSILVMESNSQLRIFTAKGLSEEIIDSTRMRVGSGISGHVAKTRTSLLVKDVEVDDRFQRRNHERYYTRSLLSVPLLRADRLLGVVNVNNKRTREDFDEDDLRLLETLAAHAAVALGNARQYEETLRRAQHDALTGLANHGHLFATLEREVERAHRYDRELALAMIDIDHFKVFNDRFGHRAGDDALVGVADVATTLSRASDLVARYGGEEFAVVLPETPLEGAVAFAEKIRMAVENGGFGRDGAESLTVSVGVAMLPGEDASANALVEAADEQLYRSKAEGRNRVSYPENEES